ncbi:hypothetical protein MASR1M45_02830 [Candidatus Kapaibacterium sp.]
MKTTNLSTQSDQVEPKNDNIILTDQTSNDLNNTEFSETKIQDAENTNGQSQENISEMITNTVKAVDMSHQSEQNSEPVTEDNENLSLMTNSAKQQEFTISKLLENIPTIDDKGYKALEHDIKTFGLRQPISIYNNEIIDGRARYKICIENKIEPEYSVLEMEKSKIKSWIDSCHINHKDMTPSQRALLAAMNKAEFEKMIKMDVQEAKRSKDFIPENMDIARMCCKHYGASYGMFAKATKFLNNSKLNKNIQVLVEQGKINLDTAIRLNGQTNADKVANFLYEKEMDVNLASRILAINKDDSGIYDTIVESKTPESVMEILKIYSFKKNYNEIYKDLLTGEVTLEEARKKRKNANDSNKVKISSEKSRTIILEEKTTNYINRLATKAGIKKEEVIQNIIEFYKKNHTKNSDEVKNG